MTQFREGDIVGYFPEEDGRQMGVEMVVLGSGEDGRPECRDLNDPSRLSGYFRPSRPRLLRRPVRVGDVLTIIGIHDRWNAKVLEVDPSKHPWPFHIERVGDGATLWWGHNDGNGVWSASPVHVDGTPIEPPKAEEKPAVRTVAGEMAAIKAVWGEAKTRHGWALERGQDVVRCPGCLFGMHAEHTTGDLARYDCPNCQGTMPTVEQLARALFETDERVAMFVQGKAESLIHSRLATIAELAATTSGVPRDADWKTRRRRVLDIMWERDEGGWRSAATERASQIRAVLLQSGLPK